MEFKDQGHLPRAAQGAISVALERVQRAQLADDAEAVIGACKDLCETTAKVALDALGRPYGSNSKLPGLADQVLDALGFHPRALQGRKSLQQLSGSLISAVQAVTELRNTDGTGHGRSHRSNLHSVHAAFVYEATRAWCQWLVSATDRAIMDKTGLADAIDEIAGGRSFSTGQLAAFLEEIHLNDLGEDDQRKVGLAVARRWTVNQTFMPLIDVIQPLEEGRSEYGVGFREGIVEGLLLDRDGYVRTSAADMERATRIAARLPGNRVLRFLGDLVDRFEDAQASQAFDQKAAGECSQRLHALAAEHVEPPIASLYGRMAAHLDDLRPPTIKIDVTIEAPRTR
jgi:Abortive infection C-terminus